MLETRSSLALLQIKILKDVLKRVPTEPPKSVAIAFVVVGKSMVRQNPHIQLLKSLLLLSFEKLIEGERGCVHNSDSTTP